MSKIAIIGMGCLWPKAGHLTAFAQLLLEGKSAIQSIASKRWPSLYFDPKKVKADHFYTDQAGSIDEYAYFDALKFKTMPSIVAGTEPDQLLSLQVVYQALENAGYLKKPFPRAKTDVILGRGAYIGTGMAHLNQRVRAVHEMKSLLTQVYPQISAQSLDEIEAHILSSLYPYSSDKAIGLVPNLCASRISNRLNLGGQAYTIDAACASALVAMSHACDSLLLGKSDLAIAGGVHLVQDLTFWSVFTQLGALSKSGQIRPFSAEADGLLIGEGIGAVVLKRLDDAIRDQDRIYAIVESIGISSDGQSSALMNPSKSGQLEALQRAWAGVEGRYDRSALRILEGHGTATTVGDQVEIDTINSFFGDLSFKKPVALGSVKSQIGHTMPASGIASVIKASLALHHQITFPTLHTDQVHPSLANSPFYLPTKSERWDAQSDQKLAAVNAFGFGGINAHLILSPYDGQHQKNQLKKSVLLKSLASGSSHHALPILEEGKRTLWLSADTLNGLKMLVQEAENWLSTPMGDLQRMKRFEKFEKPEHLDTSAQYRAVILLSMSEISQRQQIQILKDQIDLQKNMQGKDGIYLSLGNPINGKIAFLYPGVEASFEPDIQELGIFFQKQLPNLYSADQGLAYQGVGVIRLNQMLTEILASLGIEPHHIAGHSIGEWSAMIASKIIDAQSIEPFIESLSDQTLEVPNVSFLAIGSTRDKIDPLLEGLSLACSHQNCPHQSIFCGPDDQVDLAIQRLKDARLLYQKLPFKSGFHAPYFKPYQEKISQYFDRFEFKPPLFPLWSATTVSLYPTESQAIKEISARHLIETVQFESVIQALFEQGVTTFIQVGLGSLSSFVADTLRGKKYLALETLNDRKDGLGQFLNLLAQLWVNGYTLDLSQIQYEADPSDQSILLDLSVPFVDLKGKQFEIGLKASEPSAPKAIPPQDSYMPWHLSIDRFPFLRDHCFFRQPKNASLRDAFPVVPMTLSLEWMLGIAQQMKPRLKAIGIEKIKALKWIEVEPAQTLKIKTKAISEFAMQMQIEGHFQCVVLFAPSVLSAPALRYQAFPQEKALPIQAKDIYTQRWMFHGPAYQCIVQLDGWSDHGIRGKIQANGVPGALLDNVGQLFGLWLMLREESNRVMMPLQIERILFYGNPPPFGAVVDCQVWIEKVDQRQAQCRACIWYQGRVWATFEQWIDWRFETSNRLWGLMQWPEKHLYATVIEQDQDFAWVWADQISSIASSREFLVGRCLNQVERDFYRSLAVQSQQGFLGGRIVAKDAYRALIGNLYPIEIQVANTQQRQPYYVDAQQEELKGFALSIAHKDDLAVAVCLKKGKYSACGVDVERVERKEMAWVRAVFGEDEIRVIGEDFWDRAIGAWCAKECVAKACGGEMAKPKAFRVLSMQVGEGRGLVSVRVGEGGTEREVVVRLVYFGGYVWGMCLV